MSVDMKLSTKVSVRNLLEQLNKFGIQEARTRNNEERARCLTDGRHYLWVYLSDDGVVEGLVTYGFNQPVKILDAICDALDAEIYTEYDPQYWGYDTLMEWEAAMPEITRQAPCVEPVETGLEERDARIKKMLSEATLTPEGWCTVKGKAAPFTLASLAEDFEIFPSMADSMDWNGVFGALHPRELFLLRQIPYDMLAKFKHTNDPD
jgi:hypothetical protein